jgi:hypothetical protein
MYVFFTLFHSCLPTPDLCFLFFSGTDACLRVQVCLVVRSTLDIFDWFASKASKVYVSILIPSVGADHFLPQAISYPQF